MCALGNRLYKCEWKFGDVFAWCMESDLAKEKGLYGHYLLIQKVDEKSWYPGHIIPIVYVKITAGTFLPETAEEFNQLEFVQTNLTRYDERFCPLDMQRLQEDIAEKSKLTYEVDEYGYLPQFRIGLIHTSKKSIPKNLLFLGNFQNTSRPTKEFIPHGNTNIQCISWKRFDLTFESQIIRKYCGHNLREFHIYHKDN